MPTRRLDTEHEPGRTAGTATVWQDLGPPTLLVLVAALVSVLGAPWPLATPAVAAAGILTVQRCVRHRDKGWVDAAAVGGGGALVAVLLLGLILNVLPDGLTRRSWIMGVAVLEIAALLVNSRSSAPARKPHRPTWRTTPLNLTLYLATVACLATAAVVSIGSSRGNQDPDLHLAVQRPAEPAASSWVPVAVSSSTPYGPLQLLVDRGLGSHPWGDSFDVANDRPHVTTVHVPAGARVTVSLATARDRTPLRWVTIDRSDPTSLHATS